MPTAQRRWSNRNTRQGYRVKASRGCCPLDARQGRAFGARSLALVTKGRCGADPGGRATPLPHPDQMNGFQRLRLWWGSRGQGPLAGFRAAPPASPDAGLTSLRRSGVRTAAGPRGHGIIPYSNILLTIGAATLFTNAVRMFGSCAGAEWPAVPVETLAFPSSAPSPARAARNVELWYFWMAWSASRSIIGYCCASATPANITAGTAAIIRLPILIKFPPFALSQTV